MKLLFLLSVFAAGFFFSSLFYLRLFHYLPLNVLYSIMILKHKVQRNIHSSHYRFSITSFICQFLSNISSYKEYYKQMCFIYNYFHALTKWYLFHSRRTCEHINFCVFFSLYIFSN